MHVSFVDIHRSRFDINLANCSLLPSIHPSIQVYVLWDEDAHRRHQSRVLMAVLQLFGYSNSATNSFVYCWFSENFQKHLVRDTVARLIRCTCVRRPRPAGSTRVTSRGLRWPVAANSLDTQTACQSVAMQSHNAAAM